MRGGALKRTWRFTSHGRRRQKRRPSLRKDWLLLRYLTLQTVVQVDRKAEEKERARVWLNESLGRLNDWRNNYEAELENRGQHKKRSTRTHAGQAARRPEEAECRARLELLQIQSTRIELMLRCLENDAVTSEQATSCQASLNAFLERPNDPQTISDWDRVCVRSHS